MRIRTILAAASLAALTASSQAAVVNVVGDITDSFVGTSPQDADFVFTDGADSVTINVALSSTVGSYELRDYGASLINNAGLANWFDSSDNLSQDATFTATVVSSSANVDASSIEFQIPQIGFKFGSDIATGQLVWDGSGRTAGLNIIGTTAEGAGLGAFIALDNQFHDIDASSYVSSFTFLQADVKYQLKDNTGDNTSTTALGMEMTVNFSTIPEPTSLALIGLGCFALILRRRR